MTELEQANKEVDEFLNDPAVVEAFGEELLDRFKDDFAEQKAK